MKQLIKPITLPNGATVPGRIAMAPMVVMGANEDGTVSELDINYFAKRSEVANLIITGAAYINEMACGFDGQISIAKDEDIDGLKQLAKEIKKDGNKAIVQLHHAGREAIGAYAKYEKVVAPSAVDFPFLDYVPEEMTTEEIEETIKDYGRATERAIAAGFDGVEIHGANHYLIQQFFSAYSNRREDEWGGTLEKRMAFPLAVVKEVNRVVQESGQDKFIVGYRVTPEEIHGENIGYRIDETLQLVEKIVQENVDYMHVSIFRGYNEGPEGTDESYGQLVKKQINGRCPVMIVSGIFTAEDAVDALNHGDMVAIGRSAIMEPQFARKIKEGRIEEIVAQVDEEKLGELALPEKVIHWFKAEDSPLPPLPGLKELQTT